MTARKERETWDTEFAVKHGLFGFDAFNQATDAEFADAWRQYTAAMTVAMTVAIEQEVMRVLSEMRDAA